MPVQALFFNHLYDPISLVRDNEVKAAMCSLGVHCQSFNGDVLYEPWEVLAESARPFTSFATFWSRSSLLPLSLLPPGGACPYHHRALPKALPNQTF